MKVSDQANGTNQQNDCTATPLGRAIHLLGDSWVLLIIMNLLRGSMRFNTLRATLNHISSKTLSNRLKLLEELGFVQRKAFLEIPPRVEYHITEKGQELGDVIAALEKFGNKHLSNLPAPSNNDCQLSTEKPPCDQDTL
ncbi:winged helix-turn-helix transcriptional regulator [Dictyobacter kobayashii]|uniref:Transcriptional regulator n=1 Tax=Dictyobacter kobayashii TaxID=2014872 RepID=A0A402AU81_9CHLR|nr:helix-turn-helix domain-containing protein [Dictyobacter kobayashii]GCE22654.1 transcriptional regulator [Dictyobacter kobayashii]